MSSGERPIGAAKGKQSDTEALCQPPPPPAEGDSVTQGWVGGCIDRPVTEGMATQPLLLRFRWPLGGCAA